MVKLEEKLRWPARILSLEEFFGRCTTDYFWYQDDTGYLTLNYMKGTYYNEKTDALELEDMSRYVHVHKSYGRSWRAWEGYPTEEQLHTPWRREDEEGRDGTA